MRATLTSCLLAIALGLAASGCGPQADPAAGIPPAASMADTTEDYAAYRARQSEVVDAMPRHPDTQGVLARLAQLLAAQERGGPEDPRRALMYHEAASNIGLVLFHEFLDDSRKQGGEEELIRNVLDRAGPTPLGAAALHADLKRRMAADPAGFIAHTCALLRDETDPRKRKVTRSQRAEHLRGAGATKAAAFEWMALLEEQPEEWTRPQVRALAAGTLREAGLLLEADIVEAPGVDDAALRAVAPLFLRFHTDDGTAPVLPQHPDALSLYVAAAPDLDHVASAAGLLDVPFAERRLLTARMLRLCGTGVGRDVLLGLVDEMARISDEEAGRGVAADPLGLWGSHLAVRHALVLMGEGGLEPNPSAAVDRFRVAGSLPAETLLIRFSGGHLGMCRRHALARPDGEALYAEALRWHVGVLWPRQQRQAVCAAYEQFLDDLPDSDGAPAVNFALAEFYEKNLGLPQKAIESYRHLLDAYPDSPQAGESVLRVGLLLYERQAYEEAYLVFQEIAASASGERLAAALFMVALCESAMGLTEESEAHMAAFVRDHHKSVHAARGLFWLASSCLSRQDYRGAAEYLEDLVQRYPQDSYSEQAGKLLQRIETLREKT